MENGDLGDEGLEPSNDVFEVLVLVLHLNLGVILRLSITEELTLVTSSSPPFVFGLGRKRKRKRGVDAVELTEAASSSGPPLLVLVLVLVLVLLERKLQLECNLGVEGLEEAEVLKKASFPEVVLGVGAVFCWTSPSTGESEGFLGIVVQKALRHPVPIWSWR